MNFLIYMEIVRQKFLFHRFLLGIVIAGFLWVGKSQAAFEPDKWPCTFLARGSSGIAVIGLTNGFMVNPALLNAQTPNHLSLFYRNYFAINGLNDFVLSSSFHLFKVPLGLSIGQFGDRHYHEQTLTFASAWQITKDLSFGSAIRIYLLNVTHYGQASTIGSQFALLYRVTKHIHLAAVAGNLNEPKLNGQHGAIPVYFSTGLEVKPHQRLSLSLDIFKDNRFDFDFRYGLGYHIVSSITIFLGFRQQVHSFTTGIQIRKRMVHFAYALEMHPDLGMSNAIEVTYVF